MIKYLIYIIFFILTISSVSALTIDIEQNLVLVKDTPTTFDLTINNNQSTTYYNITFNSPSYFNFPKIPEIKYNQTIKTNFTITTQEAFERDETITIEYYYFTTTTATPQTKTIVLGQNSLNPNSINIHQQDTIEFQNQDTQAYTINENNNQWTLNVPAQSSAQKSFTNTQLITYYLQENSLIGTINVTSNQIQTLTHDPQMDISKTIHLNSQYSLSSLELEKLIESFEMDYNQSEEGAIRLISDGTAYQTHLTANPNWLAFKDNDFDFTSNKIITYQLIPQITDPNQTNKTHYINLTVTSANTPSQTIEIPVFINYANIIEERTNYTLPNYCYVSDALIMSWCMRDSPDSCQTFFTDWCDEFPEKCPTKYIYKNETTQLTDMLLENSEKVTRMHNKMNQIETDYLESIKTNQDSLKSNINSVSNNLNTLTEKFNSWRSSSIWKWVLIIVFGLLGSIALVTIISVVILKRYNLSKAGGL